VKRAELYSLVMGTALHPCIVEAPCRLRHIMACAAPGEVWIAAPGAIVAARYAESSAA
jgi:hypothetical protein